jgi:hypothetical protein
MRLSRLAVLAALLVAAPLGGARATGQTPAAARPLAPASRIAGTVVDTLSKTPIADASVFLQISETGSTVRSVRTTSDGRFDFQQLAAGRYWLGAVRPGFARALYGQKKPGRPGLPIDVVDRQTLDAVTVGMTRGGVVTGTVYAPDGQPVIFANVTVYRPIYRNGVKDVWPASFTNPLVPETDDRGMYRISGLETGEYFIGVRVPRTGQAGEPSTAEAPNRADSGMFRGDPSFYPGTPSLTGAASVSVTAGEERAGLDIHVAGGAFSTLSGTVTGPDGKRTGALVMIALEGESSIVAMRGDAKTDGTFSIPAVPAGAYTLIAHAFSGGSAINPVRVVVGEKPVRDFAVQLAPMHTLSGHVVWENTARAPTVAGRVTYTDTHTAFGSRVGNDAIAPDGSFQIEGLAPGPVLIGAEALPAGWAVKSVTMGGREITDLPVDYDGSSDVNDVVIVLTQTSTELRGTLSDSSLRPAAGSTVVAFPEDERYLNGFSRRIQASQTSSEGVFLMKGLPPGDYLVSVADDLETGAWLDVAVLRTLRPAGTRVHLGDGEHKSVALKFAR